MATLTVQRPSSDGAAVVMTAATATDLFVNTGKEYLLIENLDTDPTTVVFDSAGTCSFSLAAGAAHDLTVTVAGTASRMVGPFSPNKFNNGSNQVVFTTSNITDCNVAVIATT